MISSIGCGSSAEMVAMLALQENQVEKKADDQNREANERIVESDDQQELSALQDKAVDTLVGGIGSATIQAAGTATSVVGQNQTPAWSQTTQDNVKSGFGAASTAFSSTTTAMGQFADARVAQSKMLADEAQRNADDSKSSAQQAQTNVGQALDAARSIRQSEDETLLTAARRA